MREMCEMCVVFVRDVCDVCARRLLMLLAQSEKRKESSEGKCERSGFTPSRSHFSPCAMDRNACDCEYAQ
jgi:hypothetical protein